MSETAAHALYENLMRRANALNCVWQRIITRPGEEEWPDPGYPHERPSVRIGNLPFGTADVSFHRFDNCRLYWTVTLLGKDRIKVRWDDGQVSVTNANGHYSVQATDTDLVAARLLEII